MGGVVSCFPLLFYSMASSLAKGRKKPPLPQEDKRERERGEGERRAKEKERGNKNKEKSVLRWRVGWLVGWKEEASIMKVFS